MSGTASRSRLVFDLMHITDGISGGRPYGQGHTGHRLFNIARYGPELASVGW